METDTSSYLKAQINFEYERFEKGEIPAHFEALPDIPTGRYINEEFFQLEQERVFSKGWLLAGHLDEIPEIGSYRLWERSGVPILIVRSRNNEIRAFYNTCSHRGGPLVRTVTGKEKVFVCKYHSWAFGLDGELNHIPDEHEFGCIDKTKRGLKPVRCELFGNLIFINRDPDARPLIEHLGHMTTELRDFQPENLRIVSRYSMEVACNWKIGMDAFQEVYHLRHIHPETVNKALDHRGTSIALFAGGHSRMTVALKNGQQHFVSLPATGPLDQRPEHEIVRSTSLAYSMFPNIITPIAAVEFPFLVFWPITRDRSILEVIFVSRGENTDASSDYWQDKISKFNVILGEDCQNLPWIQRSIDSGALKGIPLSYQERRIYHFHEYVDAIIGLDNIPATFRVSPRVTCLEEDGKGSRIASSG